MVLVRIGNLVILLTIKQGIATFVKSDCKLFTMNQLPTHSPFKLLQPYEKGDAKVYFGREKETRLLAEALKRSKFMLLYGASGTGKTSLIQCGLQSMFSARDWMPIFVRRGSNFPDAIRAQLLAQYHSRFQLRFPDRVPNLPADLPLRDLVKALFSLTYVPIYLILDQFEEIFTIGDLPEQRDFFETLAALQLFEEDLFCKLVIVVREEYIAHFYDYEQKMPFLFEYRFRVEKMRREQLLKVVEGTLSHQYEGYPPFVAGPGAAEQIIENLSDVRGETDLTDLQVLLDRLYREIAEKRPADATSPIVFEKALVGENKLENVLSEFLEQQTTAADQRLSSNTQTSGQPVALIILFKLVTQDGTKQSRTAESILEELSIGKTTIGADQLTAYLNLLTAPEMRLLNRLKFTNAPGEYFEIWHDRLAAQVFKKFSADEMRQREAKVTIINKKKRFDAADKNVRQSEYLSKGEIELVGQSLNLERLEPEQKAFYQQSVQYWHKQRQKEKMRLATAVVAAIVFAGLAAVTYFAWQRSEIARLYNEGLVESVTNPTTGIQKIREALRRDPDDLQKRRGLYQVYANNLLYDSLFCEKAGLLNTAAFSPDGQLFATAVKSTIRLYRVGNAVPLDSVSAHNAVNYLIFKGNDTLIAGSEDRYVYVFKGFKGQGKLSEAAKLSVFSNVQRLSVDQNAQWVATTHNDDSVKIWNLRTGALHRALATENNIETTVIAPNGTLGVIGTNQGELMAFGLDTTAPMVWASRPQKTVRDLVFSPDGRRFAAAFSDGMVLFWRQTAVVPDSLAADSASNHFVFADSILVCPAAINDIEFSGDGELLLAASANGSGYVLDALLLRPMFTLLSYNKPLLRAQFTDNQSFIRTVSDDGVVRNWAFPRPFPDLQFNTGAFGQHQAWFTGDGGHLVVSAADSVIRVYGGADFQKTGQYTQHTTVVTALAAAADRVASGDERGWVHVWQPAAMGTPIGKAQFGDQPIRYLASDRAGSVVLLAGEDSTDVWLWHPNQPGTSALKIGPSKQSVAALALSPDGQKLLVAGYDSTATQYDQAGTKLGVTHLQWVPFQVHFNVKNTGFSALGPDGKAFTYLFGSEKPVLEDLPGNQQTSWTEDGTHYAAFDPMGGTDQPCQINTYTSEGFRVQSFLHRRCMGLTALALRPDGKVLAAAGGDGRVMIWRVLREGEKERR